MNKKLQTFLTNLALTNSPFGTEWFSCPKHFEDSLIAKGVKIPEHLYYQYKLPGNTKPELYMIKLALYGFFINYDEWGYMCLNKADQITQSEKDLIIKEIRSKQQEYAKKLFDDGNELLKLNPNLQHLPVNSKNVFDVLAGATFWYLPRNIEYYIDSKKRDWNKEEETNNIIQGYGIKEPYGILAPEVADMVISAIEKHKQAKGLTMTKTIIAIGGGHMGQIKVYEDGHSEQRPWETEQADRKIVELTGKKNPKIIFIGAASNDSESYFDAVKELFENRLGGHAENLILTDLSKRPTVEKIREMILSADAIYVGGGNTTRLMKALQESGTDKILQEAYNNGVIMSGNSAGGCVWFEYYDNDEDEEFDGTESTFTTKRALGFVKGYFCPHWNKKPEKGIDKESTSKDAIKRMLVKESKFGYGVDEPAAIMVQSDGDRQIMTEIISAPGAGVYKLNQDIPNIRTNNYQQR